MNYLEIFVMSVQSKVLKSKIPLTSSRCCKALNSPPLHLKLNSRLLIDNSESIQTVG